MRGHRDRTYPNEQITFKLLDEPIDHPNSPRARFEQALTQFNGSILAVVNDHYFIGRFATIVWTAKDGKIEK